MSEQRMTDQEIYDSAKADFDKLHKLMDKYTSDVIDAVLATRKRMEWGDVAGASLVMEQLHDKTMMQLIHDMCMVTLGLVKREAGNAATSDTGRPADRCGDVPSGLES